MHKTKARHRGGGSRKDAAAALRREKEIESIVTRVQWDYYYTLESERGGDKVMRLGVRWVEYNVGYGGDGAGNGWIEWYTHRV